MAGKKTTLSLEDLVMPKLCKNPRQSGGKGRVRVGFKINKEDKKQLELLKLHEGKTTQQILEEALVAYLKNQKIEDLTS